MKTVKYISQYGDILMEQTICPATEEHITVAENHSYNGEYTIEDDGRPEPEPTEQEHLRADVDFLLAMGGVL